MTRLRRAICCAIDKCYPRVMSCDVRHRDGDAGTYQNATERSPSVKAMGGGVRKMRRARSRTSMMIELKFWARRDIPVASGDGIPPYGARLTELRNASILCVWRVPRLSVCPRTRSRRFGAAGVGAHDVPF